MVNIGTAPLPFFYQYSQIMYALVCQQQFAFPAAQREKGLADYNDLALENPRLAKHQLEEAVWRVGQQGEEQTGEIGKGVVRTDGSAGRDALPCEILKETPHRFLVKLGEDCVLPRGREASEGQEVYLPKDLWSESWSGHLNQRYRNVCETSLGVHFPR
jgi:hypothetical protein